MKTDGPQLKSDSPNDSTKHSRWAWLIFAGCLLITLIELVRWPQEHGRSPTTKSSKSDETPGTDRHSAVNVPRKFTRRSGTAASSPEEIVAGKVTQFGRSRREIVRSIARRTQKDVPTEIEKFFDAIEVGHWEDIDSQWSAMAKRSAQYEGSTHSPELDPFWPAVLDAYGVAEQAHLWPAQQLLDYGNAILDSLRPGMVYVGGTDNGRWIPELLNETSGAEPHVIVTQNALADSRYLEYVNTLYNDRMTTLTDDDSKHAFQEYLADAQKRLEHDQQFPDEPKQIRPGEDVRVIDGKVQVSGQIAVMAINEKLLQALMAKNPDQSFAVQESSPLRGTYADALPLGPLMELNAQDGQNTFTADRASQSVEYWRNATQQILSDPEAVASPATLKSYSHDTVAAANLLAAHNFNSQAEQAYRLAAQLWPENPESVGGLADLLVRNGRENEARQISEEFIRQHPDQRRDFERVSAAWRLIESTLLTSP